METLKIKIIYQEPTENIFLNGEPLEQCSFKSGTK